MKLPKRLDKSFFTREVLDVSRDLIGKVLVRQFPDGTISRFVITETEAYRGTEDRACHASKGRTPRTEVIFHEGGVIYVYLIYGMYWLLNFIADKDGFPAAILIRGLDDTYGSGKVGRMLQLDRTFYGESLETSQRLWVEDSPATPEITALPRVGINYAGEPWVSIPWRFRIKKKPRG